MGHVVDHASNAQAFKRRVGSRIRRRRELEGLSQQALAFKLKGSVDVGQVSRWERGLSFPSLAHLNALARAFEISEEELLCNAREETEAKTRPQSN